MTAPSAPIHQDELKTLVGQAALQYVRPGDQVKVAPASNVAAEPAEQSGLAKSH